MAADRKIVQDLRVIGGRGGRTGLDLHDHVIETDEIQFIEAVESPSNLRLCDESAAYLRTQSK